MSILLTHMSALEALRSPRLRSLFEREAPRTAEVPGTLPTPDELHRLAQNPALSDVLARPVEILVGKEVPRRRSAALKTHRQPAGWGMCKAVPIADGLCCLAPEDLVVQMARLLTRLELEVLLGELLGVYALAPRLEGGMFSRNRPLMSKERLERRLDELGGSVPGVAAVRRALLTACVGSASPRETKLSLRLGLKPARGGYGLDVLSMNTPLEVRRFHNKMRRGVRRPDILLKARRPTAFRAVAFEYNGRGHNEPVQRAEDDRRSNELLALDVKDYVIDRAMYADLDYLDGLVEQVRRDLGYPPLKLNKQEERRRRALRRGLLWDLERIDGVQWGFMRPDPMA